MKLVRDFIRHNPDVEYTYFSHFLTFSLVPFETLTVRSLKFLLAIYIFLHIYAFFSLSELLRNLFYIFNNTGKHSLLTSISAFSSALKAFKALEAMEALQHLKH